MTLTTEDMTVREKVKAVLDDALRTIKTTHGLIGGFTPEIRDAVEAELAEVQAVVDSMDNYVLVHKSHITGRCEFDEVFNQHLVQTGVTAVVTSWIGQDEVDLSWKRLDVLAHERDKQHQEVIKYLEAPKPEQTPPAQT